MIDELAGILRLNPDPFNLRSLCSMARAYRRQCWDHTAELLALQAEINRDPRRRMRPYRSADFHPDPHTQNRGGGGIPITADNVGMMAELFVGRPREQPI